jgi:hypothetical protein
VVSIVRHGTSWNKSAVVVAPLSSFEFYTGTGRDNRIFASDSAGHAMIVSWGNPQLTNLVAVDGNLATNTWGQTMVISGSDQYPNYFYFTMSSSGAAIAFWSITPFNGSGNTLWRRPLGPPPDSRGTLPQPLAHRLTEAALPKASPSTVLVRPPCLSRLQLGLPDVHSLHQHLSALSSCPRFASDANLGSLSVTPAPSLVNNQSSAIYRCSGI